MAEKIRKLIVGLLGNRYELEAGSGTPGPDSVGTEEIQDKGVHKDDLDDDITEKLDVLDESNVITEEEIAEEWQKAMRKALGDDTLEAPAASSEDSGD